MSLARPLAESVGDSIGSRSADWDDVGFLREIDDRLQNLTTAVLGRLGNSDRQLRGGQRSPACRIRSRWIRHGV